MTRPSQDPKPRFLIVRQLSDRKEVHRTDVTGRSDRDVERVERGMLMRIDRDKLFIDDTNINPEKKP